MIKQKNGITLIALVITIIVLLILAGITINMLTGDSGILRNAELARIETRGASIEEKVEIWKTEILMAKTTGGTAKSMDKILEELQDEGLLSDEEVNTIKNSENNEITIGSRTISFNTDYVPPEEEPPKGPVIADVSGANEPNLSKIAQKTYVTWELNETGTEYIINDTQTEIPDYWYDYENGKWANIKTTNQISETETLEAYWVWVPRYEYVVPTSTTATEIEVKFISKEQITPDTDKNYVIHPAFTNAGNGGLGELDGIWVAKFEASSNTTTPDTSYGGGDDSNLKVQVKPGVQSWRNITTNNIFTVCRKITEDGEVLEGSTIDSHLMKNMEWGAVAILSQSKYGIFNSQSSIGINGDKTYQIWNNPNGYNTSQYIYTGYVGSNKDSKTATASAIAPTDIYPYDTINGTKGSTTGTAYGIYDMAGGSWEYVAGCLNGQENSKFGVATGDSRYVDLYESSVSKTGDAIKEATGWNYDHSTFINSSNPVFRRGRSF